MTVDFPQAGDDAQQAEGRQNKPMVARAKSAARQVGITYDENSKNVMGIQFGMTTEDNVVHVIMTAELTCPGPDDKPVTVWKKSESILTGNPAKMNPVQVARVLQLNAGKYAEKFFVQFSSDVKKAREKFGKK